MLRRKKKNEPAPADGAQATAEPASSDAQADATEPVTAVATAEPASPDPAEMEPIVDPEPGRAAVAYADAPVPAEDSLPDDVAPESAAALQRSRRYAPSDRPLVQGGGGEEHLPASYWVGSVKSVLTKSGVSTPEERERQAAADFQAAIMPGLMGLRDAVPDAATPDDALRALTQREAEHQYPEDPEAGSLSQRDIFRTDASVYYRIRNRFEKKRRRVGWGEPWRPPPELAQPDPPRRALNRGD